MPNVSLTKHQEELIHKKVKSGRYLSSSEVIREALRLFEEKEHTREQRVVSLKHELQEAIEQVKRGEMVDGAIVFRDLRKKLKHAEKEKSRR